MNMKTAGPISFEEATRAFQAFLAREGWPAEVSWVPRGGAIYKEGQLYVRGLDPSHAERHARRAYQIGMARGLGLAFEGICVADGRTWAHVSSPVSQEAAERLLYMGQWGTKFSVPSSPRPPVIVFSPLRWRWYVLSGKRWGLAPGNSAN
jgi:hypothetical protein